MAGAEVTTGENRTSSASAQPQPEFARLLRQYRLAAGLSQETLANKASVSLQAVSALERGFRKAPYRNTVDCIARALDLAGHDRDALLAAAERARTVAQADPLRSNLPRELTPLLGREADLVAVEALATRSPLVTLAGAGGIGKTRLAIAAGRRLVANSSEGPWFVDLAPLRDPSLVPGAVAAVLGVTESPASSIVEALLAYVSRKRLLLVLDNCEHLIESVRALVVRLLAECGSLAVIATSREALRVSGERVYRVAALDVPAANVRTAAEAAVYPAVVLFADRARAVDDRFGVSDENAADVADICRRLEGIPLAIELAAARVNVLPPRALAERLGDRLALLRASGYHANSRHSTMHAVIEWSYGLLGETERALFERLSVFAGGCTLEAAAHVCGYAPVERRDVLDVLASLVDKSLVSADVGSDERPRYRMLDTTREFALERLAARCEDDSLSHRHAEWYLQLAEKLHDRWYRVPDRVWARSTEPELDNWRSALRFASAQPGNELLLRLTGALTWVWYSFAPGEGRRWIGEALDRARDATEPLVVARLHVADAELRSALGQYKPALAAAEAALASLRGEEASALTARAHQLAGRALVLLGRGAEGETLLRGALAAATSFGNARLLAMGLKDLGTAHSLRGDVAAARRLYGGALASYLENGWSQQAALVAGHLAELEFEARDAEAALRRIEEALSAHRALRNERFAVNDLCNMSAYLTALDRFAEAQSRAFEALAGARELQLDVLLVWILQHIAALAALQPREDAARTRESRIRAALLAGFVDARLAALGAAREYTEQQEYDRMVAALAAELGAAETRRLMCEGGGWSASHALAWANQMR